MLRPSISKTLAGDTLLLTPEIEHAELVRFQGANEEIAQIMNRGLSERHLGLAWKFAQSLNDALILALLPGRFHSLHTRVSGARVWVTEEAFVIAVSFQPLRRGEGFTMPRGTSPGGAAHA